MPKGTVTVNLQRSWLAPNGSLYQPEDNPHTFPEEWADEPDKEQKKDNPDQKFAVLPSTAEVVEEGGKVVMTERLTANGTALLDPQVVDDDVKSVGNTVEEAPEASHGQTSTDAKVADAAKAAEKAGVTAGGNPRVSGPQSGKKQ